MPSPTDIPAERQAEYTALVSLLMESAASDDAEAQRVAEWVAGAALQPGHLWRSMGVADRSELRCILETHFAELAAGNTKDMRWKKYFYKRLCGWPGFHG